MIVFTLQAAWKVTSSFRAHQSLPFKAATASHLHTAGWTEAQVCMRLPVTCLWHYREGHTKPAIRSWHSLSLQIHGLERISSETESKRSCFLIGGERQLQPEKTNIITSCFCSCCIQMKHINQQLLVCVRPKKRSKHLWASSATHLIPLKKGLQNFVVSSWAESAHAEEEWFVKRTDGDYF